MKGREGLNEIEEDEKQPDSQETLRRQTPYGVEEESAKETNKVRQTGKHLHKRDLEKVIDF